MQTGWTGEPPAEQAPAMPVTSMLLAQHERGPGDTLETALARSRAADVRQARDEAAAVRDPDEVAASMVARGYRPGMISDLSMKLADTEALLAAEEDKIAKAARRAERIGRMHAAGQLSAFDIAGRMGADTDEGDPGEVSRLRRRADGLRRQLAEAQGMISPPQERAPDQFASANRTARELFAATTRQRFADAQAGIRRSEPRPFAGRGSVAVRSENCYYCTQEGVDDDTAFMIHSDPERPLPVTTAEQAALAAQYEQDHPAQLDQAERHQAGRVPMIYR